MAQMNPQQMHMMQMQQQQQMQMQPQQMNPVSALSATLSKK